jgi:hypothetical protein
MDKKPPAPPEHEPYKPADANPAAARASFEALIKQLRGKRADAGPAAAKASFDALIKQLRATPGQPELQDRTKRMREWSTFDRGLLAVAVFVLLALAVVCAAFW